MSINAMMPDIGQTRQFGMSAQCRLVPQHQTYHAPHRNGPGGDIGFPRLLFHARKNHPEITPPNSRQVVPSNFCNCICLMGA